MRKKKIDCNLFCTLFKFKILIKISDLDDLLVTCVLACIMYGTMLDMLSFMKDVCKMNRKYGSQEIHSFG